MQSSEENIAGRRKISWKKIFLGLLILVIGTASLGWLNRESIILYVASKTGKTNVVTLEMNFGTIIHQDIEV